MYPGTTGYCSWWQDVADANHRRWQKRPPAKRLRVSTLGVQASWQPEWAVVCDAPDSGLQATREELLVNDGEREPPVPWLLPPGIARRCSRRPPRSSMPNVRSRSLYTSIADASVLKTYSDPVVMAGGELGAGRDRVHVERQTRGCRRRLFKKVWKAGYGVGSGSGSGFGFGRSPATGES